MNRLGHLSEAFPWQLLMSEQTPAVSKTQLGDRRKKILEAVMGDIREVGLLSSTATWPAQQEAGWLGQCLQSCMQSADLSCLWASLCYTPAVGCSF